MGNNIKRSHEPTHKTIAINEANGLWATTHKLVRAITLLGAIEKNEHFDRVPKIISNFGAQIIFSLNLHNSSYIYTNATGKKRGGG